MESSDTKLALDEIKLNINKFSTNILKQLPFLAFIGTVLMVLLTISSFINNKMKLVDFFLTPDIYTLVAFLGYQLNFDVVTSEILASFIIVFTIAFIALLVIMLNQFYLIGKNFISLSKVDVTLSQSIYIYTSFYIYIIFISISYILPSFGWIISIIIANLDIIVGFYFFYKILKRYGIIIELKRDSFFLMSLSSFFNILAVCLVFIDISFLLISVIGYVLFYLSIRRFREQIKSIAPIIRDAPPPPAVDAPRGPAPRPSLGKEKEKSIKDVPSPEEE